MNEKLLNASTVCEILGIKDRTLWNLEYQEKLIPIRKNKRRYYTQSQIDKYVGIPKEKIKKIRIAYSRVSSKSQKKELVNQTKLIEQWSINSGKIIHRYYEDIGTGINFKRKNFLRILHMIELNQVKELVITYKDRLCRFAFDLIEDFCNRHNCKITIINIRSSSPQEELVEDLMTIIHVFSTRLYGLRQYKTKIKKYLNKNESN